MAGDVVLLSIQQMFVCHPGESLCFLRYSNAGISKIGQK